MKLPSALLLTPFLLQGLCMVADEFYFHAKRGLGKWESVGHPLDSLTVLFCFLYLLFSTPTENHLYPFMALCLFSCVFITKDEWIHREACPPTENWLHAILFILHPIVFFSAGLLWWQGERSLLIIQTTIIGGFMLYQFLRWNIKWQTRT